MKTLFVLNGAPYGDERTYSGLRLAGALVKRQDHEVRVFLMSDAVVAAKRGQQVPQGFYNLELMLNRATRAAADAVGVCGTCMDARGLQTEELIDGAHRSTLEELTDWTASTDKVLVF